MIFNIFKKIVYLFFGTHVFFKIHEYYERGAYTEQQREYIDTDNNAMICVYCFYEGVYTKKKIPPVWGNL